MPAVTVADVSSLPTIVEPEGAAATSRPVLGVTTAPNGLEGESFPVILALKLTRLPNVGTYPPRNFSIQVL